MSMIDTQNGYDLGYAYCKVCEDWSKVEHDHDDKPISEMTAAELVELLPVCPQCDKHGVMDGEMCTSCRKAISDYEKAVYHGQ